MLEIQQREREISDQDLEEAAPRVRALILERLEQIWETIRPHVDGSLYHDGGRVDIRFVEAGIRTLDRLSRMYRLDSPQTAPPEAGSRDDVISSIAQGLAELEARARTPE